jgi:hypothetical protein
MKINTTTLLLIAGAALAVYLVTRPRTVTQLPVAYNPGYNPYTGYGSSAQSTTAQDIAAGGTAAAGLANALSNLFG